MRLIFLLFLMGVLHGEEWCAIDLAKGQWRGTPNDTVKITYNDEGKIQEVHLTKDERTLSYSLAYQPHLTLVTDKHNVVRRYHFSPSLQVEKIETFLPSGDLYRTEAYEWDQELLIRKTIWDGSGDLLLRQRMVYDGQNNLLQEFLEGTLTEEGSGCESFVKQYAYDAHNRLIEEEMGGLTIAYSYVPEGLSTKIVKDGETVVETTTYVYGSGGELIESIVDDGIHQITLKKEEKAPENTEVKPSPLVVCTYDCFDRIASETTLPVLDSNDREVQWATTYLYDPLDRVIGTINPLGECKKIVYNARGQPLAIHYPDGSSEHKHYTLSGRLIKEIFRDHTFALYAWDGLGRIEKKSFYDAEGHLIKSSACIYSGRDCVKEIFSSGITIEHTYDEEGRKTSSINTLSGRKATYEYDEEGRVLQKEWLDTENFVSKSREIPHLKREEPDVKWVYNDRGQTVMQSSSKEGVILYDALHRIETIDCGGYKRHLRHNFLGQKIKETYLYQDRSITNRWEYDGEGRLLALIEAEGSKDERRTCYVYNPLGKLETQIEPNGIHIQYHYNSRGMLSHIRSSDQSIDYTLEYTVEGHIHTVTDRLTGLISLREYTQEGQLAKETLANGLELENSYDLIGRRTCLTLPDLSTIQYQYENGQVCVLRNGTSLHLDKPSLEPSREALAPPDLVEYDLAGNLVKKVANGDTCVFTYDAFHRLISVNKNGKEVRRYTYDLFHRRIMDTASGSLFIYDGNWEIGRMIEGKIAELRILSPSGVAEHGPTLAVELGGVLYKGAKGPWQFANKRKDPLTGLIHFGRRDFAPDIGKFTTPDPLGLIDGPDRYGYYPSDYFGLKTMGEWWEEFKESTVAYFEGLKDKILNLFQILKDTRSLKIRQVFEHMVGPGFLLLAGYSPTEGCRGVLGRGEISDKVRVSFTNGILTDTQSMTNTLKTLSESHGHVNIHYVYRPTKGWVYDILHSFAVGAGLVSEQAELLAKEWRHMIKEMGTGGKVIHYAHSIGAIESERALHLLTEEEQKMIFIYSFGSPNLAEAHPFKQTTHFVSVHDGVCLLNFVAYIRACSGSLNHVVFAGALLNVPFVDHLFSNQTYQDIWKSKGRTFTEWYGTL